MNENEQHKRYKKDWQLTFVQYRVWLRSVPGVYEQYDGSVEVSVASDADSEEIFMAAVLQLRRTSFPDRNISMWKMERYEQI